MTTYNVYRNEVLIASVRAKKAARALMDTMAYFPWTTVNGVRGDWRVEAK